MTTSLGAIKTVTIVVTTKRYDCQALCGARRQPFFKRRCVRCAALRRFSGVEWQWCECFILSESDWITCHRYWLIEHPALRTHKFSAPTKVATRQCMRCDTPRWHAVRKTRSVMTVSRLYILKEIMLLVPWPCSSPNIPKLPGVSAKRPPKP